MVVDVRRVVFVSVDVISFEELLLRNLSLEAIQELGVKPGCVRVSCFVDDVSICWDMIRNYVNLYGAEVISTVER